MITTESNNRELKNFFYKDSNERLRRMARALVLKYDRPIMMKLRKNKEKGMTFNIFLTYRTDEGINIYTLPYGFKLQHKATYRIAGACDFFILNDLHTLKPVMVTHFDPYIIIYSTHAVKRVKERRKLDDNMQFLDICKHMAMSGCAHPQVIVSEDEVYGETNFPRAMLVTICGVFFGYYDTDKNVVHAETFIIEDSLKEDQSYLDFAKSDIYLEWLRAQILLFEGNPEPLSKLMKRTDTIRVVNGQLKRVYTQEHQKDYSDMKKNIEDNPELLEKQHSANRKKFINKMARKGYT